MADASDVNNANQKRSFVQRRRRLLSFVHVILFGFSFELLMMKFIPALEQAVGVHWADIIDAAAVGLIVIPLAGMMLLLRERSPSAVASTAPVRLLKPWIHGLGAGLTFLVFAALCLWAQNRSSDQILKQNLDDEMLTLARLAASQLDVEAHATLINADQQNSPDYLRVITPLRKLIQSAPQIRYLYTVRPSPEGIRFAVDAAEPVDADGDGVNDQATLNELYPDADAAMLKAINEGVPAVSVEPYTDKWGTFISAFVPVRGKNGKVECILGLDITAKNYLAQTQALDESAMYGCTLALLVSIGLGAGVYVIQYRRARTVEALDRSKRFTQLITENMSDLVGLSDISGRSLYQTPSVERTLGWRADDRQAAPWTQRVHPDDLARMTAAAESNRQGAATKVRYRALRADGSSVWLECSANPVHSARGAVEMIAWSSRDVSSQIEAETKLRESEERLRAMFSALGEGVVVQDSTGAILSCNPKACEILGLTEQQLCGRDCIDPRWRSIHEDGSDFPGYDHPAMVTLRTGESQRQVIMGVHEPNGQLRWVSINTEAVRDASGNVIMVVVSFSDVTEQRKYNQNLLEAKESAEAASRTKSEFLANMSHEIRTPMNAILGYAELLAEQNIENAPLAERADSIATIRRNGEHLLTIINDILDLAKIEAGRMTVELVPTNPMEIVDEVIGLLSLRAEKRGLALRCERLSILPRTIECDPIRLRQILTNLIGNAIKFTESGSVSIRIRTVDLMTLEFAISDTGIGMSQEQMDKLFGAFQQADASTTRRFGGSGLGLRISRRLAELLGGTISVKSSLGVGSTFTLNLPARVLEQDDVEASESVPLINQSS